MGNLLTINEHGDDDDDDDEAEAQFTLNIKQY